MQMAQIYNKMFEKGEDLELGRGTLIVLPKPGKPPGPLSSLRPIVPLTTLCKTLSLIVLQRIRPAVERFLPASQSRFRQNKSTADVVCMHKWLIARIMKAKEEILVLGLDMSRAFDMLKRQLLINGLSDIIDEDSLRMVHALLDKTTLQVKIERALSEPFDTNSGRLAQPRLVRYLPGTGDEITTSNNTKTSRGPGFAIRSHIHR
jgi:hypothetical protein